MNTPLARRAQALTPLAYHVHHAFCMRVAMPVPATQTMERQTPSTEVACRLGLPSTGFGHGRRRRRIRSNTGMLFPMHTIRCILIEREEPSVHTARHSEGSCTHLMNTLTGRIHHLPMLWRSTEAPSFVKVRLGMNT